MLDGLIERYTAYLSLLEQARQAIDGRDEDRLVQIDAKSRDLLGDIQCIWSWLQPELASQGTRQLSVLQDLVARTLEKTNAQHAAVASWMSELGGRTGPVPRGPGGSQIKSVGTMSVGRFYRSNA